MLTTGAVHLLYCWTLAEATCMGSTCVGRPSCSPLAAEGFSAGFCLAEVTIEAQEKWSCRGGERWDNKHTGYTCSGTQTDRQTNTFSHAARWRHTFFCLLPLTFSESPIHFGNYIRLWFRICNFLWNSTYHKWKGAPCLLSIWTCSTSTNNTPGIG